jgi:CRP/FNR family transcriptional regulator, cyclic AMP receptor protein
MGSIIETIKLFQKEPNLESIPTGTVIYKENDLGNLMYGIIEGEVDVIVNGNVLETLKAGEIFGPGAILDPEHKRLSTAVAKTDCQLASLDKDRFIFAVQETPLFALEVMREYSKRLRKLKHLL